MQMHEVDAYLVGKDDVSVSNPYFEKAPVKSDKGYIKLRVYNNFQVMIDSLQSDFTGKEFMVFTKYKQIYPNDQLYIQTEKADHWFKVKNATYELENDEMALSLEYTNG